MPEAEQARAILGRISYMVLGTADADGRPWATPVYFATDGAGSFFWVSSPEATHSSNIAVRPEVGIVVFDSTVPIGTGQGVYMEAVAEPVADADLDRGLAAFSERSIRDGGSAFGRADVESEAGIRLYRATARSYSMLAKDGRPDHRVPVDLETRMAITHLNPATMHSNPAFSQGTVIPAGSTIVIVGGQNGIGPDGQVVGDTIGAQTEQALRNLIAVLAEAGATPADVAKMTIILVEGVDLNEGFAATQRVWGNHPTAVTAQFVRGLARPDCLVEIEAIAALPSSAS